MSTVVDVGSASVPAVGGFAMSPLPARVVLATLGAAIAFALVFDTVRRLPFARLGIA
jgi:hypothetical protein